MNWPTENDLKCIIRDTIMQSLTIRSSWIGNPSTSDFGIKIELVMNGCPISNTIVDFIDKTD